MGTLKNELPDYKVWNTGDIVAISPHEVDLSKPDYWKNFRWFKITNRQMIARDSRSVASASLPAAASSVNLENASNWLDWLKASNGTFMALKLGFVSDHYVEWDVRMPKSTRRGGTQGTPEKTWTSDDSSFFDPQLVIYSFTDKNGVDWQPVFTLYNRSQYTLKFAKVGIYGWKYGISEFTPTEEPRYRDLIILTDVGVR